MSVTGWQPDGTYVPCPQCRYAPQEDNRPGTAVHMPGTTHLLTCPTVPRLSAKARQQLQDALDEIDECRRRAMASAHLYVIG